MHWTASLRNQTLPEHARVAADLPCITCGYNLRRAKPDGICPECGGGVQQTLDAATCPRELGTAFKRVAATFPPMIAVFLTLSFWVNGSWMCIIGALILLIAGIYRVLSIIQLRATKALQPWPVAERGMNTLLVLACIEAAVAGLLLGGFWFWLKSTTGAFDLAAESLLTAWVLLAVAEIALVGLVGRSLVPAFGYAILRWESTFVLGLLAAGFFAAGLLAVVVSGGGGLPVAIDTFRIVMLCIIVPAAIGAAILLFHLGNAAERVRDQIEDLLEADV